jgi:L-alanine-DL-glutamate epimerase-like enolase superfamily enzyme
MKITDISYRVVNTQTRNWIFVRADTGQDGLYGWDEATLEWKTRAVVGAIEDLRPFLIGRDLHNIEQLVRIMPKLPIACGERLVDRQEFDELFRSLAIDIVQPDICHCGRLLETQKIAARAETALIGVAPHNPLGPIAGVAPLHSAVSTPNHVIQEEMSGAVPWYAEMISGPIRLVDGHWQVPKGPSLGIEVDEDVCMLHPFRQEVLDSLHAFIPDGTVVD